MSFIITPGGTFTAPSNICRRYAANYVNNGMFA